MKRWRGRTPRRTGLEVRFVLAEVPESEKVRNWYWKHRHRCDVQSSTANHRASPLERSLDANTAFEIVSIDIADIDVGENIGARLQTDQAEADTRVAQARAEVRRAAAIATQQEMQAKLAESRAMLMLAEAEIPPALARAFRAGQLHVKRRGLTPRGRLADPQLPIELPFPGVPLPFESRR